VVAVHRDGAGLLVEQWAGNAPFGAVRAPPDHLALIERHVHTVAAVDDRIEGAVELVWERSQPAWGRALGHDDLHAVGVRLAGGPDGFCLSFCSLGAEHTRGPAHGNGSLGVALQPHHAAATHAPAHVADREPEPITPGHKIVGVAVHLDGHDRLRLRLGIAELEAEDLCLPVHRLVPCPVEPAVPPDVEGADDSLFGYEDPGLGERAPVSGGGRGRGP
jgi:hypothetical protein